MEDFPSWERGNRVEYPALRGSKQADVAIIGGGLTGLSLAAMLAGNGLRVILLEDRRLACGASWACTGKVTAQLGSIYRTVADSAGIACAQSYARMAISAVREVEDTCRRLNLDCALRRQDTYLFARCEADVPALEAVFQLEKELGLPVLRSSDAGDCPLPVEKAIVLRDQLSLQPVPYCLGLAEDAVRRGCQIYEQSPVRRMADGRVVTPAGRVEATHVVLATGSPIGVKSLPLLAMMDQRVCQVRVMAGGAPSHNSHLSASDRGMTFRPCQAGMLAVRDVGRAGCRHQDRQYDAFRRQVQRLLRDWQQTDCITRQDVWSADGLPLIGPVHAGDGHRLMAAGYSGWGVVNAHLAARVLSAYLLGQPMEEAAIFAPTRQYPGHGRVVLRGGMKPAGAFLAGLPRMSAPVCPHMGCRMRYDLEERRWRCPCHGSSFSVLGECLNGPAYTDADVSHRQRPDG